MSGNNIDANGTNVISNLQKRIAGYLEDGVITEEEEYAIFLAGKQAGLTDAEVAKRIAQAALEAGLCRKDAYASHVKLWVRHFLKDDGVIDEREMFILQEYSGKAGMDDSDLKRIIQGEMKKYKRGEIQSRVPKRLLAAVFLAGIVVAFGVFLLLGATSDIPVENTPESRQQVVEPVAVSASPVEPAAISANEERPEMLLYEMTHANRTPEDVAAALSGEESAASKELFGYLTTLYNYLGIPIVKASSSVPLEDIVCSYSEERAVNSLVALMKNTDIGDLILQACQASAEYPAVDIFATKYAYDLERTAAMPSDQAIAACEHRLGALESDIRQGHLPENRNAVSDVMGLALFLRVLYVKEMCNEFGNNFQLHDSNGTGLFKTGMLTKTLVPAIYYSAVQDSLAQVTDMQNQRTTYSLLLEESGNWAGKSARKLLKKNNWTDAAVESVVPLVASAPKKLVQLTNYGLVAYARFNGCNESLMLEMDEMKSLAFILFMDSYFDRHDSMASLISYSQLAKEVDRVINIEGYKSRYRFYFKIQECTKKIREILGLIVKDARVPESIINDLQMGAFLSAYDHDMSVLEKLLQAASIDCYLVFDTIKTLALLESAKGYFNDDEDLMMDVGREYAKLIPLSTEFAATKSSHKGWLEVNKFLKGELGTKQHAELDTISKTQPEWLRTIKQAS